MADGTYFINRGADQASGHVGAHGTFAKEDCPIHRAQIGWQAEQKLRELEQDVDRQEQIRRNCTCNNPA